MTTTRTTATVIGASAIDQLTHRRYRNPVSTLALTAALVVVADLTVKTAVFATVPDGTRQGVFAPLTNPDFSLGLASAPRPVMVMLMAIGVLAATLASTRLSHRVPPLTSGLVIGGASANTLDRALHGAVRDYLIVGDLIINLADAAVLVGLAVAAAFLICSRERQHTRAHLTSNPSEGGEHP